MGGVRRLPLLDCLLIMNGMLWGVVVLVWEDMWMGVRSLLPRETMHSFA